LRNKAVPCIASDDVDDHSAGGADDMLYISTCDSLPRIGSYGANGVPPPDLSMFKAGLECSETKVEKNTTPHSAAMPDVPDFVNIGCPERGRTTLVDAVKSAALCLE